MDDELLERYIIGHFKACQDRIVYFSWHGGEPLIAGLEFYRKVVSLQKKHCPHDFSYVNGIQTNGTLLNDEWCSFFATEKFNIGLSIDGPEDLHNRFRRTREGLPTYSQVINGLKLLRKNNVIPEILCVVNSENVKHPLKIYNFLRRTGAKFVTFLPLVEREPDLPGGVSKDSVPSEDFGLFLSKIFDQWVSNGIGEIKIQIFEEAARVAFDQDHTLCLFKKTCGGVPVLERNGNFYSCDHYVDDNHLIGNIRNQSLEYLLTNRRQREFGLAKLNTLPAYCVNCSVRDMCNGECPKNRFLLTPDGEPGLNYLCEGYKYFFAHCRPFVEAIRQMFKSC
jgi:uncharacterized protein